MQYTECIRLEQKLTGEGVHIYVEVVIVYGHNVINSLSDFKKKVKKEIENLTAMNVGKVDVIAKSIQVPSEK